MTSEYEETTVIVGGAPMVLVRGGVGKPLLVLHDELGFPGWLQWNKALAQNRALIIPLQPGFGRSEGLPWLRDYRDLAVHYTRLLRQFPTPIDVIGFSAGGYLAAEIAAVNSSLFDRMVLVAPLGVRPSEGEIFDFLAVTARTHVAATVGRQDAPEFATIYGGDLGGDQFMLFEAARAETSRLSWEPFMFDPALPHLLSEVEVKTLLIRGTEDIVSPPGCIDAYAAALPWATAAAIEGVGHRPEIEDPIGFLDLVETFFSANVGG